MAFFLDILNKALAVLSISILIVYSILASRCINKIENEKKKKDLKFPFHFMFLFVETYSAWGYSLFLYKALIKEQGIIACIVMGAIVLFWVAVHIFYYLYTKTAKKSEG